MKFKFFLTVLGLLSLSGAVQASHEPDGISADHPLRYRDFVGEYINHSFTAAGAPGVAVTSVARLVVGAAGAGQVDFVSTSLYTGPVGTPSTVITAVDNNLFVPINFQITITNPNQGGGKRELIDYPTVGATLTTNFIAKRRNGKVKKFNENVVGVTGYPNVGAALILNQRQ